MAITANRLAFNDKHNKSNFRGSKEYFKDLYTIITSAIKNRIRIRVFSLISEFIFWISLLLKPSTNKHHPQVRSHSESDAHFSFFPTIQFLQSPTLESRIKFLEFLNQWYCIQIEKRDSFSIDLIYLFDTVLQYS